MMCRIKKKEEHLRANCSWYVAIEKCAVLTEVRSFVDPHLDKARCLPIIKKLLYLLNQGETFTKSEAAAVLSCVINLYRFQDVHLRRMFYLIAKELCPVADEVALVTSSLLKDINSSIVIYRANAIRSLCHINYVTYCTQIIECLDHATLDENPMVRSASLVCAINMLKLKRDPRMLDTLAACLSPATAMWKSSAMCKSEKFAHFHALYLFFMLQMYVFDTPRVESIVDLFIKKIGSGGMFKSFPPLSLCLLARSISQVPPQARHVNPLYYEYLKFCIYHEDEMVAIEGFRSLEEFKGISFSELKPAMDVIYKFLLPSQKPVLRFGAFRVLRKVGVAYRSYIMSGNKLYYERDEVNHREEEYGAEVTQVVKSQSYLIKEAPTHNLRRRQSVID